VPLDFAFLERGVDSMLPYVGHIAPDKVLLKDGSVLAMAVLHGKPHELHAASERNAAARTIASLWRNIAAENLTVGVHLVRRRAGDLPPPPVFRNSFSRDLDRVYRERVLHGQLFENRWYLSIILSPRTVAGTVVRGQRLRGVASHVSSARIDTEDDLKSAVDHAWLTVPRSLETHSLRRLGLREQGGVLFSEIGEALRQILYCDGVSVPLAGGYLGNTVYTDRVVFGPRFQRFGRRQTRIFEVQHPGHARYGALFSLREYPDRTQPGIFDSVLSLPCELVLSQSFSFLSKNDAGNRLSTRARHMINAGDRALSQLEDIQKAGGALDELMSGKWVMGQHSLSLAIYANTLRALPNLAALARTRLADSGAVVIQESSRGGLEAGFFAQLPGNLDWQIRPGAISSINFAHMADFGAFPTGAAAGRWGPAMMRFKTTGATAYDFTPHVDDVGMSAIFGRISSGKSTALMFALAMVDQYMAGNDGTLFFFDKDRGGEILAHAVGGRYLVIHSGEDSGLHPLKGLADTPADRTFLTRWLRALILLDGHGPIDPEDDARIADGVACVMRLPQGMRSLLGLRQLLGWHSHGAGARLERWCRGGPFGWAFDGQEDQIILAFRSGVQAGDGVTLMGFDLTEILEDPEVANPAGAYLLYFVRRYMDGRRGVAAFDEFWKYFLHPQFAELVKDFLLTARKSNWIVLLVTQQPEHVLDDAFGATLVGQCHTLFLFPTPTADEDAYREKLFLTEGELRSIREDMQPSSRRFLIKRRSENAESVIVDFDLSAMPEYVAVLSGRARTVRHAERLRETHGERWLPEFLRTYTDARD
jgi:type IV secretion system protein VirB4